MRPRMNLLNVIAFLPLLLIASSVYCRNTSTTQNASQDSIVAKEETSKSAPKQSSGDLSSRVSDFLVHNRLINIAVDMINTLFIFSLVIIIFLFISSLVNISHKVRGYDLFDLWKDNWFSQNGNLIKSKNDLFNFSDEMLRNNQAQKKSYPIIDIFAHNIKAYCTRGFLKNESTLKFNQFIEEDLTEFYQNSIPYENTFMFFTIVAPPIGFLGTILGLIRFSADLSTSGLITMTTILPGLKDALITTMFGLFIMLLASGFLFVLSIISDKSRKRYFTILSDLNEKVLKYEIDATKLDHSPPRAQIKQKKTKN